jgi:hypothetical protein
VSAVAAAQALDAAARRDFRPLGDWLSAHAADVNTADTKGWTVLHYAAAAEASGVDVEDAVNMLLQAGADPHKPDAKGDTPFNVAAANSPVAGRLMTLHWLAEALEGRGEKLLNDRSGSHGSTLAQYMAKWLSDAEIETRLKQAVEAGLKPDVPNASGWTPLTAAAAMGRSAAVRAFIWHYTHDAVYTKTTEAYETAYQGRRVAYAAGLSAAETAFARLTQDSGATGALQNELCACIAAIMTRN